MVRALADACMRGWSRGRLEGLEDAVQTSYGRVAHRVAQEGCLTMIADMRRKRRRSTGAID